MVVSAIGDKFPNVAMMIMGWIVGIPVFCDSGYVVLNPIRKALSKKILGANPIAMAVALSGGLYVSHVLIPPTPGPIAAAGAVGLGENLLLVIGVGVLVSIPVLIALVFISIISFLPFLISEQACSKSLVANTVTNKACFSISGKLFIAS